MYIDAVMPITLSIKNVPDEIVRLLKERAKKRHRSLQRELLAILDEAVRSPRGMTPREVLAKIEGLGIRPT